VGVVLLAAVTMLAGCGKAGSGGVAAPDFVRPEVRSGRPPLRLAAFKGKPVVLNFWAAWCDPCAREMPALQRAHAELGDRVAFVGVDGMDSRRNALALLHKAGTSYAAAYDPTDAIWHQYHLLGRPTTVFIGADGRIKNRHAGPLTTAQLLQLVRRFFGDG
jgi:cytochrome c biogenesis protein CcmG, thiol:disulfide interchange protein DsbE